MVQNDGSWLGCHGMFSAETVRAIRNAQTATDINKIFEGLRDKCHKGMTTDGGRVGDDDYNDAMGELHEEWYNAVPQIRKHFGLRDAPTEAERIVAVLHQEIKRHHVRTRGAGPTLREIFEDCLERFVAKTLASAVQQGDDLWVCPQDDSVVVRLPRRDPRDQDRWRAVLCLEMLAPQGVPT